MDRNLTTALKITLVKILVRSVLLYGLEGWTLSKADETCVLAAEMWFWRGLLNISLKDKRTNRSILEELGVQRQLLGELGKRKLTYIGHIIRGSGISTSDNRGKGRRETERTSEETMVP